MFHVNILLEPKENYYHKKFSIGHMCVVFYCTGGLAAIPYINHPQPTLCMCVRVKMCACKCVGVAVCV